MFLDVICQGAQIRQIRAENDGAINTVVAGDVVMVVEAYPGVQEEVQAEENVVPMGSIP